MTYKKHEWFIGYLRSVDGEGHCIEYPHRSCDNLKVWVYPFEEHIQYADKEILSCKVEGTWDISDSRNTKLCLFNGHDIQQLLQEHIKNF